MELTTVLELVKAGFSKDEIMQMEQPTDPVPVTQPVQMEMELPQPTPEPTAPQVTEPVAVPTATPVTVPTPVPEEKQPSMADIMQSIAKLTSAVQANAIAQSVIPQGLQNAPPSAEDMLAEIIRPTFKERV